jgi:serine phosphatase RsbU (regulator of sigma subunit)/ABC-type amino acid transport substrate-binding protein
MKAVITGFLLMSVCAHAAVTLTDAQRDWLREHGKIVFAADTEYPPYTFAGSDGQARGLDADVAQAMGRVLGVQIEVRAVPWADALTLVKLGQADVLAGMAQSEDRRDRWVFVEPHADVKYFLFVREDVHTIHEIKDLDGMRVGVGKGSLVEPVLRANRKITVVNYEREKGMKELLSREISAFAGNLAVQSHFIEASNFHGIKIVGAPLITPVPYGMAVPKNHEPLAGILTAALNELKAQGELAELQRKWFGELLRPPIISPQALRGLRIGLGILAGLAVLALLRSLELRRIVHRKTARISALHSLARSFGEARDVAGVLARAMDVLDPLTKPDAVFVVVGDLVRHVRVPEELLHALDEPVTSELAGQFGFRSASCLPIVAEGVTLGTLGLLSRREKPDADFQHAVAAELGIAVANAMLFATLEQRVEERTRQLNERNRQLEADLSMAREVQLALQPMLNTSAVEIARQDTLALWMTNRTSTARMVGGDFFNVMRPTPDTCCVFICDVMGQGARAALLTAILRTLLDKLTDDPRDAQRFMTELNRRLMDVLKTQETPIFATAFYACFDFAARQVSFANAGHPWPVLFDRQHGRWELVGNGQRPGPALGIFQDASFPPSVRQFAAGQSWLLYTDGLYEMTNDAGESFGMERVQALLNQEPSRPVAQVLDGLMENLARFTGHDEVDDDVCLLAVEAKPAE